MQLDLSRSTKSCRMWRPFLFFCFVRSSGKGADEERTTSCRLFIYHTIYANPLKTLKRKCTMFSLFKKWFQQQNEFTTEFKSTEINKIKNVCPNFKYPWVEKKVIPTRKLAVVIVSESWPSSSQVGRKKIVKKL